jgi:hypothetical protein
LLRSPKLDDDPVNGPVPVSPRFTRVSAPDIVDEPATSVAGIDAEGCANGAAGAKRGYRGSSELTGAALLEAE